MKLIVQIPCYNEEASLAATLAAIPRSIPGIATLEILVVDDGSTDATAEIAKTHGAHHILSLTTNRGLASAFRLGMEKALELGADIIVNTDGDGQYKGEDIPALIAPILTGSADIVIGERDPEHLAHYTGLKKSLHACGTTVVQRLSGTQVADPVSGFRAIRREAALKLNIFSSFSYTTEMVIQAGNLGMRIASIPIRTNTTERPSRLFTSVRQFVMRTALTILRTYCTYKPLKVFAYTSIMLFSIGMLPVLRFLFFYLTEGGAGHIQSLVLGGVFIIVSFITLMFALLADVQARNRVLLERILERLKQ